MALIYVISCRILDYSLGADDGLGPERIGQPGCWKRDMDLARYGIGDGIDLAGYTCYRGLGWPKNIHCIDASRRHKDSSIGGREDQGIKISSCCRGPWLDVLGAERAS